MRNNQEKRKQKKNRNRDRKDTDHLSALCEKQQWKPGNMLYPVPVVLVRSEERRVGKECL